MVKVVCRKIGNSMGFIIPSKLLYKVDIAAGDMVEVSIENNKLILQKKEISEDKETGAEK